MNNLNENRELYDLIRQISKGLRKHGIKKVIRALKEINVVSDSDIKWSTIDYIERIVCEKLGVPMDELFNFESRGEITIARKFCILLIRNHVPDISDDDVGNHYNRSRQVVHNTEKEYRAFKNGKKTQFHNDFLSIYNELDMETKNFIKNLNNKKQR